MKMKTKISNLLKSEKISTFLILLVPAVIILFWFRSSQIKAIAEPGLLFYDPGLVSENLLHTWMKDGLGQPVLTKNTWLPILYLDNFLIDYLGFKNYQTQALYFYFLIVVSLFYWRAYLRKIRLSKGALENIIVMGYLFNALVVGIMNRFQLAMIVLYFYVPVVFFFLESFLNWDRKNVLKILFFPLISLLFYSAFDNPANFISINLILVIYLFFKTLFLGRNWRNLLRSLLFYFYFLIINVWWLLPYVVYMVKFSGSDLSAGSNAFFNLSTYDIISKQYSDVTSIVSFFLGWVPVSLRHIGINWDIFEFFSVIPALLLAVPIRGSRNSKIFTFSLATLLITLYIASGARIPLYGEINKLLFLTIPPYQAFRNPIEKIGIYLPFFVFLSLWVRFSGNIPKIYRMVSEVSLLCFLAYFACFYIYVPVLSTNNEILKKGYDVEVPKEYKEFSEIADDIVGRILILPLNNNLELVRMKWDRGYDGREPFNDFTKTGVLSAVTWYSKADVVIRELDSSVTCQELIAKMENLGISDTFIFKDIRSINVKPVTMSILEKEMCIGQHGSLSYENDVFRHYKMDYPVRQLVLSSSVLDIRGRHWRQEELLSLVQDGASYISRDFYKNISEGIPDVVVDSNFYTISPDNIIWEETWIWPNASISPSSFIYPLVALKENFQLMRASDNFDRNEILMWQSFKRLIEGIKYPETSDASYKAYYEGIETLLMVMESERGEVVEDAVLWEQYFDFVHKLVGYIHKASKDYDNEFTKKAWELTYSWLNTWSSIDCEHSFCKNTVYVPTDNASIYIDLNTINVNNTELREDGKLIKASTEDSNILHFDDELSLESNVTLDIKDTDLLKGKELKDFDGADNELLAQGLILREFVDGGRSVLYVPSGIRFIPDITLANNTEFELKVRFLGEAPDFSAHIVQRIRNNLSSTDSGKSRYEYKSILAEDLKDSDNVNLDDAGRFVYTARFHSVDNVVSTYLFFVPSIKTNYISSNTIESYTLKEVVKPTMYILDKTSEKTAETHDAKVKKINSAVYLLDSSGLNSKYFLKLNQLYSNGWLSVPIKYDGNFENLKFPFLAMLKNVVAGEDRYVQHFVANKYANGWEIDGEAVVNDFGNNNALIIFYGIYPLFIFSVFLCVIAILSSPFIFFLLNSKGKR